MTSKEIFGQDRLDELEKEQLQQFIEESPKQQYVEGADFETAMSYTGFGKFNYLLMLVAIPVTWAKVFDTSAMSYILPSAECDLQLTNLDKGALNGMVYAGMISSAFIWGYLSDTLGRRRILVYGLLLLAIVGALSGFSQVFWVLALFKFIGGFISSGPFAVFMAYLSETSGKRTRASSVQFVGIYTALATVAIPGLAWLIIPQDWSWNLEGFKINSWRLFLIVCALPSFTAGVAIYFFDESPKFLMVTGRREEALRVFQRIYSVNTGKAPETYPVRSLLDEQKVELKEPSLEGTSSKSVTRFLALGFDQVKPFFLSPFLRNSLLVFIIQFFGLMSQNTIRLWIPQLFATMEEYMSTHENASTSICDMLLTPREKVQLNSSWVQEEEMGFCEGPGIVFNTMYMYSMVIGAVSAVCNLCASSVINRLGKKTILVTGYLVGSGAVTAMYWSNGMEMLLVLAAVFVGTASMCVTALLGVVVDLFPTSHRTMAVSLTMMFGRVGVIIGNVSFPLFLDLSCVLPFFIIGAVTFGCIGLTLLLPKTTGANLQ